MTLALCSFEGPLRSGLHRFPVAMARGKHLFPFRTEPLSPSAPMVLGPQGPGRVGRRRFFVSRSPVCTLCRRGFVYVWVRRGVAPGRRVCLGDTHSRPPPRRALGRLPQSRGVLPGWLLATRCCGLPAVGSRHQALTGLGQIRRTIFRRRVPLGVRTSTVSPTGWPMRARAIGDSAESLP